MYTPPKILLGTDNFAKLVLESEVFVDKSLFIKEFLEDGGDVVLITRPRRWGKSMNMSMVDKFLSIALDDQGEPIAPEASLHRLLFMGGELTLKSGAVKRLAPLKIAQETTIVDKYQGRYPVISLGLKNVKGHSYEQLEAKLKLALLETFQKHAYLLDTDTLSEYEQERFRKYLQEEGDTVHIQDSLRFLSKVLYRHFGQSVYILVDEYDTPVNSAYLRFYHKDRETFEQVLELFRELLGKAMKGNEYLKKGLITGILRIAKSSLFSDLNNIREYTLLDRHFATSYGFTQAEVDELLEKVPISTTAAQIQHWYNGYTFAGEVLYNPWSIMCCLGNEGALDYYWIDSGGTALVDAVLVHEKTQEELHQLLNRGILHRFVKKKIIFDTLGTPDSLYTLLLFSGYLNAKPIDAPEGLYELSVPNYELRHIYKERVIAWVEKKLSISSGEYLDLAYLLVQGEVRKFETQLQRFLDQATSFHQTEGSSEVFYNGFMLALLSMLAPQYRIESEYESGSGRVDAMLIPKSERSSRALVLEYKVCTEESALSSVALAGLEQIMHKKYAAKVQACEYVREILVVSLAFCSKKVTLASDIITP